MKHWRAAGALASVIGLAALGCGDSGSERTLDSTPVDGSGGPATTAMAPGEVHVRIPFANDLPEWGRQIAYTELCSREGRCPTLEEALAQTDCSAGTFGPELLSSPRTQIVTGCGLIAVHRPGSGSYWYEGYGSLPVAVGDFGSADIGLAVWAATRSIECEPDEQTTCSVCDDGYPPCGDPSTGLLAPPPPAK